jgi:uncharacterized protein (DUF1778 family)
MSEKKTPPHPNRTQTAPVLLRFEPTHLEMIDHAAEHLGLARASWIRSTLLQAAREVLRERERH